MMKACKHVGRQLQAHMMICLKRKNLKYTATTKYCKVYAHELALRDVRSIKLRCRGRGGALQRHTQRSSEESDGPHNSANKDSRGRSGACCRREAVCLQQRRN